MTDDILNLEFINSFLNSEAVVRILENVENEQHCLVMPKVYLDSKHRK